MLPTLEVPGSDLIPETANPDLDFVQSLQTNAMAFPEIEPRLFMSRSLQFSIYYSGHLII